MSLRDLGVDADLERVYRLLLALPAPSVALVAESLGLPADQAGSRVDRLCDLGLVRRRDGVLVVPDPTSAIGGLIERVEDETLAGFRRVISTRSELASFARIARAAADERRAAGIERIEDLVELRDKIEELSFFTRHTSEMVQSGGPPSPEALRAAWPLDERLLRRGVAMRLVREQRVLDDGPTRQYLHDFVALGGQVRVTPSPLHRTLVYDGEVAVVPVEPSNPSLGALVVREPALLVGFQQMFERVWSEATDIAELEVAAGGDEPSATDRRLLQLMLDGATDEVAARELAMSTRHLRRQLTRLFAELGVQNRFAAGVAAARRGWV